MGAVTFLLVDDDALVRRAFSSFLGRYGESRCVGSAREALAVIGDHRRRFDGLMIDVRLGDGCGLDVLAEARKTHAAEPAVVFSGTIVPDAINRANVLNARFVCKPCGSMELAPFIADVLARGRRTNRVATAAERARQRWALSPRETEIVEASLRGTPRDELIARTGMAANTFKTHVRRLLDKTDYPNLASLAIDLLQE